MNEILFDYPIVDGKCSKCGENVHYVLAEYTSNRNEDEDILRVGCLNCDNNILIKLTCNKYFEGEIIDKEEWKREKYNSKQNHVGVKSKTILQLMKCFYDSAYINANNELILEDKRNIYINLNTISSDYDLLVNLLEQKSWYIGMCSNTKTTKEFRERINTFLQVDFSKKDWETIYIRMGNGVNTDLTEKFIDNDFNLKVL